MREWEERERDGWEGGRYRGRERRRLGLQAQLEGRRAMAQARVVVSLTQRRRLRKTDPLYLRYRFPGGWVVQEAISFLRRLIRMTAFTDIIV